VWVLLLSESSLLCLRRCEPPWGQAAKQGMLGKSAPLRVEEAQRATPHFNQGGRATPREREASGGADSK
jgi:hypothetical protein